MSNPNSKSIQRRVAEQQRGDPKPLTEVEATALRSLTCLFVEAPERVAQDVTAKCRAAFAEKDATIRAQAAEIERCVKREAFVEWFFSDFWNRGVPDEYEAQDKAVECGILKPIPGGFDPNEHHDASGCAEPGDEFFEFVPLTTTEGE